MRQAILLSTALAGVVFLSACGQQSADATVERALQDVNAIDETNLNAVMLTAANPNEAVLHFRRTLEAEPDRIDLQRGLSHSLVRAKRYTEAVGVFETLVEHEDAQPGDMVNFADALIRTGDWARAEETLDQVPPTYETFRRYRLEAVVADSNEEWEKSDSFYEIAVGLTTSPAPVLNNWGYSKLTRGDYTEAERLFGEAIRQDNDLFTAKNNLVLARAAQRNYSLPVVPMQQTERAHLLHTMGLSAIKQGDVETGKGLLRDAIETHPQHFEAAARALDALEANVGNG